MSLHFEKKTILILDDDPIDIKLLRLFLQELDVNIISINDSNKALEMLNNNPTQVDLLIQDHCRPGINGLGLLEILQKDPSLQSLPVFVLTAGFSKEKEREYYEDLNIPIFDKPIKSSSPLFEAIRKVLRL